MYMYVYVCTDIGYIPRPVYMLFRYLNDIYPEVEVYNRQSWKKFPTFLRIGFQFFTIFLKMAVILAFATSIHSVFYAVFNVFSL